MNRSQIEYILTLADLKNFGKAAEACFVTQSTLSAMVAKFEEQTGVVLFNRKTRPITITPQGESVIKSLKSINREFQLLDEQVNSLKGYEAGNLSIACIPTVAPYLYPKILSEMSKAYSKVNFTIHEFTTEQIVEEILAGHIDVGIVSTPLDHNELIEYPMYYEDFLLYDCGDTKRNKKYKVTDIDLDRLWLMEEGHCLRNQVGKICELRQQKKIHGNLTYSCGTIFTLIEMVKKNQGVTLLPRLALGDNHQIEQRHLFTLSAPVPKREIGLITHKNFIKDRMLKNLKDIIETAVALDLKKPRSKKGIVAPF